jgi:Spy/CpxP family protein refolding chaperone
LNPAMKATITLLAALALASTAATSLAQTPAPCPAACEGASGKKHHDKGGSGRLASLNLTPDQKAKMDVLRADLRTKVGTINSNAALTPEQKKEQIKGLRQANRTQVEAILTPDQLAQLKKAKTERKEHHKAGGEASPQASPAK